MNQPMEDLCSTDPIDLDSMMHEFMEEYSMDWSEMVCIEQEREEEREAEIRDLHERIAVLEARLAKKASPDISCPFCEFTASGSSGLRTLKLHLASGECKVPVQHMVHTKCQYPSSRFALNECGETCLLRAGFQNPYDIENEFYRFRCSKCNFKHWHKTKFNDHVSKCRGSCSI